MFAYGRLFPYSVLVHICNLSITIILLSNLCKPIFSYLSWFLLNAISMRFFCKFLPKMSDYQHLKIQTSIFYVGNAMVIWLPSHGRMDWVERLHLSCGSHRTVTGQLHQLTCNTIYQMLPPSVGEQCIQKEIMDRLIKTMQWLHITCQPGILNSSL